MKTARVIRLADEVEQFPVQRGIPIPPERNGRTCKYPLEEMLVGDSFFVPGRTRTPSAVIRKAKLLGYTVVQRKIGGGVRVWRVE